MFSVRYFFGRCLGRCPCVWYAGGLCMPVTCPKYVTLRIRIAMSFSVPSYCWGYWHQTDEGLGDPPPGYPGPFSGQRQGWKTPRGPTGSALLLCV